MYFCAVKMTKKRIVFAINIRKLTRVHYKRVYIYKKNEHFNL